MSARPESVKVARDAHRERHKRDGKVRERDKQAVPVLEQPKRHDRLGRVVRLDEHEGDRRDDKRD